MSTAKIVFRNRMAAFLWGFAAVWMLMLVTITWVYWRDGAPVGYSEAVTRAILAAFWVAGLGIIAYVSSKACFTVSVARDKTITVSWRYPHRVQRQRMSAADVEPAEVIEARDDEGEPYFFARFISRQGDRVDFYEGHDRRACEDACLRFNIAIGKWQRPISKPPA
jgi:hypothetical protein